MNRLVSILWLAAVLAAPGVCAGAAFRNLDFEQAILPVIPRGQVGGRQPVHLALPGWRAFAGEFEFTNVLHNNGSTGSSQVAVNGPQEIIHLRFRGTIMWA